MAIVPDNLLARPRPDAVAIGAPAGALRVIVPSLARGGAERIVIEWLAAAAHRGRKAELAILHRRRQEYQLPAGITAIRRGAESVEAFADALGARWCGAASAVSAHLVPDALLARLWAKGVRTVPVIHNTREGWRNDPAAWPPAHVPLAIACAEAVRVQAQQAGSRVPVVALRHRPTLGAAATDMRVRKRIRAEWHIAPGTFVIGVVGAFKAQKDHCRAVEVLAALRRSRDACLVILGGTLDASGYQELDRVVSRASALGVGDALRLPGFVEPVEPWYAAFDALLNVSRHEGLSMATQEALGAALPVIATDVGGQGEIEHPNLCLLRAGASASAFAERLAALPVRAALCADAAPRFPRIWSLTTCWQHSARQTLDTLFATANLNAGGAQRSLVNLACRIAGRHRFAIGVCGETTHPAFAESLATAGVNVSRFLPGADAFDAAEGIVASATRAGARNICFWNVDPRVKLLVARFAPPGLRLIDVSPGAYAYQELEGTGELAHALAFGPAAYYQRLDVLVTKFDDRLRPACRRVEVIANGVALREPVSALPPAPRFLVSGRIAPSKRLETILEAFAIASARVPRMRMDIVGQAEPRHRDYLERIFAATAGFAIEFHGACPGLDYFDAPYTAAVVLGTHQGCPNVVLEAMAAGLAVIANDSGGTGELVRHGETGWLLPEACTAVELARALVAAAGDAARAQQYGRAGRVHVARNHSLEDMAIRYLSIFENAVQVEHAQDATHPGLARLHPA
ncbi:MAG: glycosyltransferase [Betaproteobacteria bacterium]